MGFKNAVESDISNIFLNIEEFGTEHTLNGRKVICVLDEEKFQSKQKRGLIATEEGVFQNGFTMFIGSPYLKLQPHTGENISIDGVRYEVAASKHDMGMFEIDLFRNEEI